MSYINEALKKAQELKDSAYSRYHNIAFADNTRGRRFGTKFFVYLISAVLLIFFLFSGYRWLGSSNSEREDATAIANGGTIDGKDTTLDKKELYDKALSLQKSDRLLEAKKLYEAVITLDPGYIEALNNLGVIYIHDNNFNAARDVLNKAVRLNPSYVDSYYNLACLNAIKGDIGQGLDYLKKAISLDTNVKEWARKDTDLQRLKASEEFKKIVSE